MTHGLGCLGDCATCQRDRRARTIGLELLDQLAEPPEERRRRAVLLADVERERFGGQK